MQEENPRKGLIKPEGDLTASNAMEFKAAIIRELEDGCSEITLDFDNVEIIDSTALSVIISLYVSLEKRDGKLSIVNLSQEVYGLLNDMRLAERFTILPKN